MRKYLIVLSATMLAALFFASCGDKYSSRRDATSVGEAGWVFEGWACAPDAAAAKRGESPAEYCKGKNKKELDYLYMKFSAAASDKAIASGRLAQMMATCREAARLQVAADGINKVIGEYLERASGVSDGQSTGSVIVSQNQGQIRGIGLYDCCAMDNNTGDCVKKSERQNWEQCMCVGYMRFSGGQDKFMSAVKEADR